MLKSRMHNLENPHLGVAKRVMLISAPNHGAFLILQSLWDQGANPLILPSTQAAAIAALVQPPPGAAWHMPRIPTARSWSHLPRKQRQQIRSSCQFFNVRQGQSWLMKGTIRIKKKSTATTAYDV
jgi:hypothetical protein